MDAPGGDSNTRYDEATWFSFLTYSWLTPLVEAGLIRQVCLADTPELGKSEDTSANARALLLTFSAQECARKSHPFLRAVVLTFWQPLLIWELLRIFEHFVGLLNPLLLQQVLIFQEAQSSAATPADVHPEAVSRGLTAVFALLALGFFSILFGSQLAFFGARLTVRISSAVRGAVLHRCVVGRPPCHGTPAAAEDGKSPSVYNVLSFDVGANVDIIWIVLDAWLFPFQFVSTLLLLYHQVHSAVIPGLAVIVLAKTACFALLASDGLLRDRQLAAKDRRLGLCTESFSDIRTLQMLGWGPPFMDQMLSAREGELRLASLRLWMQKMAAAIDYTLPAIVTLATLSYYVAVDGRSLKASVALPVLALVNSLVGPFGQFPIWAQRYLIWRSAYDRVNRYICVEARQGVGPPAPEAPGDVGAVASFSACTLAWALEGSAPAAEGEEVGEPLLEADTFRLGGLDLRIHAGELLVVCGGQGQGKTSLLQGLLGELVVAEGSVASPAITRLRGQSDLSGPRSGMPPGSMAAIRAAVGSADTDGDAGLDPLGVAYSAQSVALFAGTVRSNILFGAPYEPLLFRRVVKACALDVDLEAMPLGELTDVAQGGTTLSGGQRARVGLARAVYRAMTAQAQDPSCAPLVLLDDPFSSLDRGAAAEVCGALFGPSALLATCAVVVSTADAWWAQPLCSDPARLRLAVLRDGRVLASGPPGELRDLELPELRAALRGAPVAGPGAASDPMSMQTSGNPQDDDFPQDHDFPQEGQTSMPPCVSKRSDAPTQTTPSEQPTGGLAAKEGRAEGGVAWDTYLVYLNGAGRFLFVIMLLALVGIMVFQNLCTLWVAYWTSEDKASIAKSAGFKLFFQAPPEKPHELLKVYACLVACFAFFNIVGHGLEIICGIRAARRIFEGALKGTLSRSFAWWDANPTGRVINRFTEDVEVMDKAVTNIIGVLFGAVLYLIGHCVVLALANAWTLALLPFCVAGMEYFAKYYRKTVREVHRIYLVNMSCVYQHMAEALMGGIIVRAFAALQRVAWTTVRELDDLQRASFAKMGINLWISLRMSLIGYTLNVTAQLQPVLQYFGYLGPQSAALVGFSIEYSRGVVGVIQQIIMNFSDLEMQLVSIERLSEYARQEPSWTAYAFPTRFVPVGDLRLRNVEVSYRPGLPPALSGVNLAFAQHEVTAVIGRTGAGKSSMLLSILQLVPYHGVISVGEVSLGDLPPLAVRTSVVGVVPQQPVLFEGGLRWNLDPLGKHTEGELFAAMRSVGLHTECSTKAHGLGSIASGSVVGDGNADNNASILKLSHGQQQLLCAARVLLRRPSVVLLDEVSASLPPDLAMSTVTSLLHNCRASQAVTLLVTHQECMVSLCDRVITVAAGSVVKDERCSIAGHA